MSEADRAIISRALLAVATGPVRRTIRRVPGLISATGRAIERSGVVPRTRAWINKEEPTT